MSHSSKRGKQTKEVHAAALKFIEMLADLVLGEVSYWQIEEVGLAGLKFTTMLQDLVLEDGEKKCAAEFSQALRAELNSTYRADQETEGGI